MKIVNDFKNNENNNINIINDTDTDKRNLGLVPHCNNKECPSYSIEKGYGKVLSFFLKRDKAWKCYVCNTFIFNPIWKPRDKRYTFRQKRSATRSLTRKEIFMLIKSISPVNNRNAIRDRALISILYLTGARIEEVVGLKDHNKKYIVPPLKVGQIQKYNDDFYIIKEMPVLKRRAELKLDINNEYILDTPKRNVPIFIKKELPFWNFFKQYLDFVYLKTKNDNAILFKMTYQRAWQITNKYTKMFNHLFRHSRASHLVEHYNFADEQLRTFFGWATNQMASNYVHLNMSNIIKAMADTYNNKYGGQNDKQNSK